MAEGGKKVEQESDLDPQQIETLILLYENTHKSSELPKNVLLKHCSVTSKDSTERYATRPQWPYGLWSDNSVCKLPVISSKHSVKDSAPKATNNSLEVTCESCEGTSPDYHGGYLVDKTSEVSTVEVDPVGDICKDKSSEHKKETDDLRKNVLENTSISAMEKSLDLVKSLTQDSTASEDVSRLPGHDKELQPLFEDTNTDVQKCAISGSKAIGDIQLNILAKLADITQILSMSLMHDERSRLVADLDGTKSADGSNTTIQSFGDSGLSTSVEHENKNDLNCTNNVNSGNQYGNKEVSDKVKDWEENPELTDPSHNSNLDSAKTPKQNDLDEILFGTFDKSYDSPRHWSTELYTPVRKSCLLNVLIENWLSDIKMKDNRQIEDISSTVWKILSDTIEELKNSCFIFIDSKIIETGSMAEGSRILKPDEFDFTITLPELAKEVNADLVFTNTEVTTYLNISTSKDLSDFLIQFPFVDSAFTNTLTNAYLLRIFQWTLEKHMPRDWQLLPECQNHSMRVFLKNQTLTLHVYQPVFSMKISIDICFGIPLSSKRIDSIRVNDDFHAVTLKQIQAECEHQGTEAVAVISKNALACGRVFFLTDVRKFEGQEAQRRCYMLAKYIARQFLPSITKNNCALCTESMIPSFYLKTAFFFMMDYYSSPQDWDRAYIGNRLIEAFDILRHSMQKCGGGLAYHSFRFGLKMDFKASYQPTNQSIKLGVGLTDLQECSIPRTIDIEYVTDTNVKTHLDRYWRFLETESWIIGDLLEKLVHLLIAFKEGIVGGTIIYSRGS